MGFRWDTYVNNSAEEDFTEYLLITAPKKAIVEYKCPVFKRRSFFQPHDQNLYSTIGESASELLRFLRKETDYDTDMIFENIIRTCNMTDVIYNLGLFYTLPEDVPTGKALTSAQQGKCALIMHIYYLDILDEAIQYASSMPAGADIYITTPFERQKAEIEKVFSVLKNRIFVRIIENRGRDVSALLVGCADVVREYEYICFWHDKKSKQVKPESVGRSWGYKVSNCVLASEIYVCNVIRMFEENPFLGILSPLPPAHGLYFNLGTCEWGLNYEKMPAASKLMMKMFIKMLDWKIGADNDFRVTTGKHGKYLKRFLREEEMERFQGIFPNGQYEDIWEKLFLMYDYFAENAGYVAGRLGFFFDREETERVRRFLCERKMKS